MAFHDHTENGITVLQSDLLCGSIRHGFSTRTGGVSPSPWNSLNLGVGRGDDPANVQENFRRLCGVLGLSHQRAVLSKQVHEDNIRLVTESDCGKGLFRQRDYASVDAMICREKHIPLVVFSADCGTILLYDPVQEAIGAVHAGWRGWPAVWPPRRCGGCRRPSARSRRICWPPRGRPSGPAVSRRTMTCQRPCAGRWVRQRSRTWCVGAKSGT